MTGFGTSNEREGDNRRADLRYAENPFFVLGIAREATLIEIERTGKKLLAQLELNVASVKIYRSPRGEHVRTAELVRNAIALLRDPDVRIVAEFWAETPLLPAPPAPASRVEADALMESIGLVSPRKTL